MLILWIMTCKEQCLSLVACALFWLINVDIFISLEVQGYWFFHWKPWGCKQITGVTFSNKAGDDFIHYCLNIQWYVSLDSWTLVGTITRLDHWRSDVKGSRTLLRILGFLLRKSYSTMGVLLFSLFSPFVKCTHMWYVIVLLCKYLNELLIRTRAGPEYLEFVVIYSIKWWYQTFFSFCLKCYVVRCAKWKMIPQCKQLLWSWWFLLR